MHELLAPLAPLDQLLFEREFVGMTTEPIEFAELQKVSSRLLADIRSRLTGDIAQFLVGLHDANPNFESIGLPEAATLPAVRWKVMNLARLKQDDPGEHLKQQQPLTDLLT